MKKVFNVLKSSKLLEATKGFLKKALLLLGIAILYVINFAAKCTKKVLANMSVKRKIGSTERTKLYRARRYTKPYKVKEDIVLCEDNLLLAENNDNVTPEKAMFCAVPCENNIIKEAVQ